jgi:hypothetical protein
MGLPGLREVVAGTCESVWGFGPDDNPSGRTVSLVDAPGQHRERVGHGQVEFDVVPGVVPAPGQVEPDVRAVVEARVAAPVAALVRGQRPRPLQLVEQQLREFAGLPPLEEDDEDAEEPEQAVGED